jgi:hypothetical protein
VPLLEEFPADTILEQFPTQVVSSHALVVAQISAGETVEAETFFHLAAELLSIAKVARLCSLGANFIGEAEGCWRVAFRTFSQSAHLWNRLADDTEAVEMHRRLLERLCAMATDQLEIYDIPESGRTRERY